MKKLYFIIPIFILFLSCKNTKNIDSNNLVSNNYNENSNIISVEEIFKIWETKGTFDNLNSIYPSTLLYLDSNYSKRIIDLEFKSGFLEKHPDSTGIFWFKIPDVTLKIVNDFGDIYAADKLFEYYKKLPKYVRSDTMFLAYNNLEEIFNIFIHFKPLGLNKILKKDYDEWNKLSKIALPVKYKSIDEYRSTSFKESMKLKNSDLYYDCNYITFQLAYALKELNEPGFDDKLINELKKKQTYPFINSFELKKKFYKGNFYKIDLNKEINLNKSYNDIKSFIDDSAEFKEYILNNIEMMPNLNIGKIIYDKSNKAYFETHFMYGRNGYIIFLNKNKLYIDNIWSEEHYPGNLD